MHRVSGLHRIRGLCRLFRHDGNRHIPRNLGDAIAVCHTRFLFALNVFVRSLGCGDTHKLIAALQIDKEVDLAVTVNNGIAGLAVASERPFGILLVGRCGILGEKDAYRRNALVTFKNGNDGRSRCRGAEGFVPKGYRCSEGHYVAIRGRTYHIRGNRKVAAAIIAVEAGRSMTLIPGPRDIACLNGRMRALSRGDRDAQIAFHLGHAIGIGMVSVGHILKVFIVALNRDTYYGVACLGHNREVNLTFAGGVNRTR